MGENFARIAYLVLLLIAVGGFLLVELRERPGKTLRMAAAWGMIFLGAIALAGLWPDIRNRAGEPPPCRRCAPMGSPCSPPSVR